MDDPGAIGTTQFGLVVKTPSESTVKLYEEIGKVQFERGQREALKSLNERAKTIVDAMAAGSSVEIGEPVTKFDEATGNMHFTIPITMRGFMAENYLAWRKENGYEE
jgi:hypothetical protein